MDSDLLATFGDLANGNSSASKEVGSSYKQTLFSYGPSIFTVIEHHSCL